MRIFISIICVFFFNNCYSQIYTRDKKKFVNIVLSDTGMGEGNYLALKVKQRGSDSIKVFAAQAQSVFYYYHEKFNWDGKKFMHKMTKYLLYDQVLIIDDKDDYFDFKSLTSLDQCNCNNNVDSIVSIFNNLPLYARRSCLIYNLFKKNIMVGRSENHVHIIEPPSIRGNVTE